MSGEAHEEFTVGEHISRSPISFSAKIVHRALFKASKCALCGKRIEVSSYSCLARTFCSERCALAYSFDHNDEWKRMAREKVYKSRRKLSTPHPPT